MWLGEKSYEMVEISDTKNTYFDIFLEFSSRVNVAHFESEVWVLGPKLESNQKSYNLRIQKPKQNLF